MYQSPAYWHLASTSVCNANWKMKKEEPGVIDVRWREVKRGHDSPELTFSALHSSADLSWPGTGPQEVESSSLKWTYHFIHLSNMLVGIYVCIRGSRAMDKMIPKNFRLEIIKFSANKNVTDICKVLNALFHAALLPSESKCTTPLCSVSLQINIC